MCVLGFVTEVLGTDLGPTATLPVIGSFVMPSHLTSCMLSRGF